MASVSIEAIGEQALGELAAAEDKSAVEAVQTACLGRRGKVTLFLRNIGDLPPSQRADAGRLANQVKHRIEQGLEKARQNLQDKANQGTQPIDVSLPGRVPSLGRLHPLTQTMEEICSIFNRLGFAVAEGPEVEMDYYNFEALNIPANHPARDMQDTFYVSDTVLLRTHTSPVQIRTMAKQPPPVRIIAPGKVYRCDSDITHTPMFHQVEGLLVDAQVSFGDLKGTLTAFVHQIFDRHTGLRFRPSFFPFTEPSAEVDIVCVMCRGKGCRVCSSTGWLEVLGSGMVHPALFENVGYPPGRYTGFAFGMGVERIAMLKFGIDDIRKFFDNDLRFLHQF